MTSNLLETDQALSQLLEEVTTLRSASQQLNSAGHMASDAIHAAERVTELSAQVMQNSSVQLNSSTELTTLTRDRMADVIAEQKTSGERMTAMTQEGLNKFSVEQKSFEERMSIMTKDGFAEVSKMQKSYTDEMRQFIQSELHPQLSEYQRATNINRWLLIVTLLLAAANFGFVIWSVLGSG